MGGNPAGMNVFNFLVCLRYVVYTHMPIRHQFHTENIYTSRGSTIASLGKGVLVTTSLSRSPSAQNTYSKCAPVLLSASSLANKESRHSLFSIASHRRASNSVYPYRNVLDIPPMERAASILFNLYSSLPCL